MWQSRSGNPRTPWLEPDIVDHTTELAGQGTTAVVVCPVGFISDHMEVVWDLDTELANAAEELDVVVERTRTVGPTDTFTHMVLDLVAEVMNDAPPIGLGNVTVSGCTTNGEPCRPGCCQLSRPNSPTA